jgi:hypothetical protein
VTYDGVDYPNGYGVAPASWTQYDVLQGGVFWILSNFGGTVDVGEDIPADDTRDNSLKDGVYRIVVDGAKVHDRAQPLVNGSSWSGAFYRLFGDVTGPTIIQLGLSAQYTAIVNPADNLAFRNVFNCVRGELQEGGAQSRYAAEFDFDGNGVINPLDYLEFLTRFNKPLSWVQ